MKTISVIFTCTAVLSLAAAKITTPPSDIVLIYPTVKVNKNHNVTLGFSHPRWPYSLGLIHSMSMNLTHPNGTNSGTIILQSDTYRCVLNPNPIAASTVIWTNDTGLCVIFFHHIADAHHS
jgi:hypothetical protein